MKPDEVIEEVKKSGLRGRGGAGFPTGMKWSFIPKSNDKPKYLCVNADEGEPGTFKDRLDPGARSARAHRRHRHLLLRGRHHAPPTSTFAASTTSRWRASRPRSRRRIAKASSGKNIKGSGVDVEIVIHRGAGAYICGDETGLIESLEGKKGQPRPKPPFPGHRGRVRLSHRRQQCRDHFGAAVDHASRRRRVRRHRHGEEQGHHALLDLRHGGAPGRLRECVRREFVGVHRTVDRRREGRQAPEGRHSRRLVVRDPHRRGGAQREARLRIHRSNRRHGWFGRHHGAG